MHEFLGKQRRARNRSRASAAKESYLRKPAALDSRRKLQDISADWIRDLNLRSSVL